MEKNIISSTFEKNKKRVFLIDASNEKTFTYEQFNIYVATLCSLLRMRGVKRASRIAVCLPNSAEFAAFYFAALYSGFHIIPINTNLSSHELEFVSRNCKADFFVYSKTTEPYVINVLSQFPSVERIKVLASFEKKAQGNNSDGFMNIEDYPQPLFEPADKSISDIRGSSIFAIMYTSGTTQFPKGVAHCIDNMVQNATAFIDTLCVSQESRFYNILSMAYMAGFYNLILLPFLAGASVVIGDVFNPQQTLQFWKIPKKYDVNTLWLIPTILSILLKLDRGIEGPEYCRYAIKQIFVGTAPLPAKLQEDFEKRYGVRICENYGLSETLFISSQSSAKGFKKASVGAPLPNCAVKVIGPDGAHQPYGREGELVVFTPSLMLGYLNENTGNVEAIDPQRGFPTGDIGYMSPDGYLFITGRKKDLIIKGGINISPHAIEAAIMNHTAIEQAVAIGIPHAIYGEDITAVVKLKPGYNFEETKPILKAYCKSNLSAPQQPSLFFEIEEFPLSSTGKINRKRLKNILFEKLHIPREGFEYNNTQDI